MNKIFILALIMSCVKVFGTTSCICTTVPCPIVGENTLLEGLSGKGVYNYENNTDQAVVKYAYVTITNEDIDHGSETTSCTQDYSRMLDDEDLECDAGHILANRLGGPGNEPINIFPQKPSVNRGIYKTFEQKIYDCLNNGSVTASLYWEFFYEDLLHTRPYEVYYNASFVGSDCEPMEELFDNVGT